MYRDDRSLTCQFRMVINANFIIIPERRSKRALTNTTTHHRCYLTTDASPPLDTAGSTYYLRSSPSLCVIHSLLECIKDTGNRFKTNSVVKIFIEKSHILK